jgi:hypothetical protein
MQAGASLILWSTPMLVPLGNDTYVNAAHISLLSGVQRSQRDAGHHQVRLLLMGKHEHTQVGPEEEMKALHARIKNALDQLGP